MAHFRRSVLSAIGAKPYIFGRMRRASQRLSRPTMHMRSHSGMLHVLFGSP